MSYAMEIQENRTVKMAIEKGRALVGIANVVLKIAEFLELLSERERIEIWGRLPDRDLFRKEIGGGAEDEGIRESLAEIKSLQDTLVVWIEKATRSGEKLEVTISII